MREIEFRGKAIGGDWVSGNLTILKTRFVHVEPGFYISNSGDRPFAFQVDPETVVQYTGLKDRNGVKIFEGDIVRSNLNHIGDVRFSHGVFGVEWTFAKRDRTKVGDWGQLHNLRRLDDGFNERIEVIGNIHDNPELLEDNK